MSRVAYVNGAYVRASEAFVHVEDRGYQFADGVYEVCSVLNGRLLDEIGHLDRLDWSLSELRIHPPMSRAALRVVLREIVRRNHIRQGIVYLQVTRGVAPRNHPFPKPEPRPSLVVTGRASPKAKADASAAEGVDVITTPDERWARPDIKTISLLPNCLAKQAAVEAGAFEAWMIDRDGFVTEGSSTNAWIIDKEQRLITRPAGHEILNGITRRAVLRIAKQYVKEIVERPFTLEEALNAQEAFITSATSAVTPVVRIDDKPVANGAPGSIAESLRKAYFELAIQEAQP